MNTFNINNPSNDLPKILGETRHYPPAVKEWNDSIYAYDKNYLKNLPSKDIMASKIIKNYFNLNNCKHLARSKRMRTLIRKSSVNKLFVSRPEIKQTNDNVSITIYTLDVERQLLLRKIFRNIRKWEEIKNLGRAPYINVFNSYEHWRLRYNLNKSLNKLERNILSTKKNSSLAKHIKNKYLVLKNHANIKTGHLLNINRMHLLKTRSNMYTLKKIRRGIFFNIAKKTNTRKNIPYFGTKSLNEVKFLRYISQFKNNSIEARKHIYYSYMKHILYGLGVKVLSFEYEKNNKIIEFFNKKNCVNYKDKILLIPNGELSGIPEILSVNSIQENLPYIDKINILLSKFVYKLISNNNLIKKGKLSLTNNPNLNFKKFLYKEYTKNTMLSSKTGKRPLKLKNTKLDFMKKEISLIKNFIKVKINNFKFGKYLPALKLLVGKIYNKNIHLNIVKLKYLYLNSDIYTDAITMKLRKKKINFRKVLKNSINLVKMPNEFNKASVINNIRNLDIYKSLKIKNLFIYKDIKDDNADNLDLVIKNVYPSSLINQQKTNNIESNIVNTSYPIQKEFKNMQYISSKITHILNIVKYKWVTGVRLEAAGRLTRRYTAARSVYKYRNKGSLKNTDFARKLDFMKKSMPVVILRNNAKTNSQYTSTKSKRRIGAFGLKGWISSY